MSRARLSVAGTHRVIQLLFLFFPMRVCGASQKLAGQLWQRAASTWNLPDLLVASM